MKRISLAGALTAGALLTASAPLAGAPAATAQEPPRPNIIVIVADDLGYGDLSSYGSKIIRTPNLDALAAEGVRFTQGYVTHPVCAPSRAAILTGRYQQRFGFEFNPVGRDRRGGVALSETFIGQVMREAGYRTAMVGKWHLGQAPGYQPLDRGFDEFFGITAGASSYMIDPQPGDEFHTPPGSEGSERASTADPLPKEATPRDRMVHARRMSPVLRGREPVEVKGYLTDAFTGDAVRFIGENRHRPFFLYLAYNAPHTPLQVTAKYAERYRHVPDKGARVYAAMVSALDDGVGAIRAKLKAEGLERNTLVIFVSDNGCAAYVLGACSNAPLNGHKGSHLEGGVRVPYIVSWPGRIPGGRVDDRPVSSLDIAPTAAALARGRLPKPADGVNLIPYLTGGNAAAPHPTLYWRAGPNFAIRDGDWKLWLANKAPPGTQVSHSAGITPDGTHATVSPYGQHPMLYDLKRDRGERRNLAPNRPTVVAALKAKLSAWDAGNAPPQWTSMRQSVKVHDRQALQIYD
ncbi:sulfatase-like hydrolase/transferase [Phenylobacterium sp. VNQ135]|uniref:sulfatase-like hydrolase/transferase n=1 Tax=Phenylobacterium sp. VNQ135 TaxID=3400922 RepID=UPI003BFC4E42